MAKKQKCPEFENHERWLVAFADMMTLLFALFVVLYSIANVEMEKLRKVSNSLQRAFGIEDVPPEIRSLEGGVPKGNSRSEGIFDKIRGNTKQNRRMTRNMRERAAVILADMKTLEQDLNDRLYGGKTFPSGAMNDPRDRVIFINQDNDGIRVTLLARKFFGPNETKLDPKSRSVLDAVALAVKGLGRQIRVEGHTDNQPFHRNGWTNWELSSARAASVVRYFVDFHKFSPQSIYPAGFADTRPVAGNDTPENRSLNRRIDIKILYDSPSEYLAPAEEVPESNGADDVEADSEE